VHSVLRTKVGGRAALVFQEGPGRALGRSRPSSMRVSVSKQRAAIGAGVAAETKIAWLIGFQIVSARGLVRSAKSPMRVSMIAEA